MLLLDQPNGEQELSAKWRPLPWCCSREEVTELNLCAVLLCRFWSHDCLLKWFHLSLHQQVMLADLPGFLKAS